MIETFERLRLYALFVSVPYALLWSHALVDDAPGAASALFVATHALGVLLLLLCADRADEQRTGRRTLALWRFPLGERDHANSVALPVLALLTLVSGVALIIAAPALGFASVFVLAIGLWQATRDTRRKLVLVELLAPLGVLILPMLLLSVFGPASDPIDPAARAVAIGATLLGATLLGLTLLMCQLRDLPTDALTGVRTTATNLGRRGATRLAWVWIVAAVMLSAMGASWGWWGWVVSASVALAGLASGPAFARGAWERAVIVWTLALWIAGLAFLAQAISW